MLKYIYNKIYIKFKINHPYSFRKKILYYSFFFSLLEEIFLDKK